MKRLFSSAPPPRGKSETLAPPITLAAGAGCAHGRRARREYAGPSSPSHGRPETRGRHAAPCAPIAAGEIPDWAPGGNPWSRSRSGGSGGAGADDEYVVIGLHAIRWHTSKSPSRRRARWISVRRSCFVPRGRRPKIRCSSGRNVGGCFRKIGSCRARRGLISRFSRMSAPEWLWAEQNRSGYPRARRSAP